MAAAPSPTRTSSTPNSPKSTKRRRAQLDENRKSEIGNRKRGRQWGFIYFLTSDFRLRISEARHEQARFLRSAGLPKGRLDRGDQGRLSQACQGVSSRPQPRQSRLRDPFQGNQRSL